MNGILQHCQESVKQETFSISALKSNGNVITDSLSKKEIVNSQYKSVSLPILELNFPSCRVLNATKLINIILLQYLDKEITPVLYIISLLNHFAVANY